MGAFEQRPTLPGEFSSLASRVADLERSPRVKVVTEAPLNVKYPEFGAKGDNSTDDVAAILAAVDYLPSSGGKLFLPKGTYRLASSMPITKNGVHFVGEGINATILKPTLSAGYLLDVSVSGKQRFEGFAIDGTSVTGTGQAVRYGSATSRIEMANVLISNFTNNGNQFVMVLEGSLDNTFTNVDFENNTQHLRLADNAANTYPSNQNCFYACKFQTVQWASGTALLVEDSEGNLFDGCLFQGNKGINTITVTNNTGGNAPARANMFRACWLEENGNSQAGSHNFHIVGTNTGALVLEGTVIEHCLLLSTNSNNPTDHIYLSNAKNTRVVNNYSNANNGLTIAAGVSNTFQRGNVFAGAISDANVAFRAAKSAAQTITNGAGATKVTWPTETFDTNANFDNATNYRWTPTVRGLYKIAASIQLENCDDQQRFTIEIRKSGGAYETHDFVTSGTVAQGTVVETAALANGSSDYFEVFINNLGGTARNVGTNSSFAGTLVE